MSVEDVGVGSKLGPPLDTIIDTPKPKPKLDIDELGFYSVVGRAIDELPVFKKQKVVPKSQAKKALIKQGATKEELDETGLTTFLEGEDKVTQQELQDYFEGNKVVLSERVLKEKGD